MKKKIYYAIPAGLRPLAMRLYYLPTDTLDCILKRRPEGVPPRGLVLVGQGDYVKHGEKFLKYFIEQGGLKPHHKVLDVGCGIGRMAVPLTRYLGNTGSYDGFDIVKSGIDWCNRHIAPQHTNFIFRHISLHNALYNTGTHSSAAGFAFPYDDSAYDFVFLTSVFTHMIPSEVSHYIAEISRVLKPGGTCFASFFILNDESKKLMEEKPMDMNFPVDKGFYRLHSAKVDAANVAYEEEWVAGTLAYNGMEPVKSYYGQWCGRENYFDYQDIVVSRKKA